MTRSILVIDDESSIRQTLSEALKDEGYKVRSAASGPEGIELTRESRPDIVLLDIWMPEMDGIEVLRQIKTTWPDQIVVMMSGHGTIEIATKAVKMGAFDFLEKPLSLEKLLVILQNAAGVQDLARENQALREQITKNKALIGLSPPMKQIQDLIRKVAPSSASVLITGENGTGKELVAHSIHALSPRYSKPFVEVNCAAIPDTLIESELFGYEKGAFSGALSLKRGKFDLADGGTLFLDEIGDMSLSAQAKVLRILQEQKFERVGGVETLSIDVRVIAATNKDLKSEIQKGNFREDLFYRLNVVPFQIPPLRERREDIPALAKHFLIEFAVMHGRKARELSPEGMRLLQDYPWPGNVRELRNLILRLTILASGGDEGVAISTAELLRHMDTDVRTFYEEGAVLEVAGDEGSPHGKKLKDARQRFEKEFIVRTLKENENNISKTAAILGVERSHLHRKMKSYGIET